LDHRLLPYDSLDRLSCGNAPFRAGLYKALWGKVVYRFGACGHSVGLSLWNFRTHPSRSLAQAAVQIFDVENLWWKFMASLAPKLGMPMSPVEAKAFVDELNGKVRGRWEERVTQGAFMNELGEGRLSMAAIKLFFFNWGAFTVEINTLVAASYHKHIGFFKRQADLLAPFGAKVADEFMHPKPPGHIPVMLQTAEALGLAKDEILRQPMLPEARAIVNFKRSLLWEGTVAEWWFSMLTEEPIGYCAAAWFKALTTHCGLSRKQATYFSTHEEADLEEHDEGVMGHGSFNHTVTQRILEDGYADVREGYSLEYCALASVDLYGVMHRAAYELGSEQ
jgi:pyrroloquinoline quinone (PQQ) biosynthesis protein C